MMLRPLFTGGQFDGVLLAEFQISTLFETFRLLDPTLAFQVKFGASAVYSSPLFIRLGEETGLSASTPIAIA